MSRVLLTLVTLAVTRSSEDPLACSSSSCTRGSSISEEQPLTLHDVSLLQVDLQLGSITDDGKVSIEHSSIASSASAHGKQHTGTNASDVGSNVVMKTRNDQSHADTGVAIDTINIALVTNPTGAGAGVDALSLLQSGPVVGVDALSLLQSGIQTQANGGVFAVFMMLGVAVCILMAIWCHLPEAHEVDAYHKHGQKTSQTMARQEARPSSRGGSPQQFQTMPYQKTEMPSPNWSLGGAAQSALLSNGQMQPTGLPPASGDTRASLQSQPSNALPQTDGVPPVCPSLILPNTEARFMISMDKLKGGTEGKIDIKGTSGRTLLHAQVERLPDGRRALKLASVGCEQDPRTTVTSPAKPGGAFQLAGKSGQPYGTIDISANGDGILTQNGRVVMTVEKGDPAAMKMSAKTRNEVLATTDVVTQGGGQTPDGANWKLTVKPGADAVLITTCMLSMLLLGAESGRPSGMPGVPRAPGSFRGM